MKYYSTNNHNLSLSFRDAVLTGLADDGGLLLPERIPELGSDFISNLSNLSFTDICFEIASGFIEDEIKSSDLGTIVSDSINFPAPLVKLDDNISVLELFHGPTLAFKDFGARFMARVVEYFIRNSDHTTNILVATSGDTGSAVANGFLGMEGIKVFVLYPGGKISQIQEKQITTLGENITAIEVDGSFDDCQDLVKKAFVDPELKKKINLSSANSINIGRLIPQTFYYFEGFRQLKKKSGDVVFSVPSGNLGNLTAGIISKKMGLPIKKMIAAVNSNKTFFEFIKNSEFKPRATIRTYSNAMDVGNPNNFYRISGFV